MYHGIYAGVVISNKDPIKLGRVKARVPTVYGPATNDGDVIADNDIPWAYPAGIPAGGTANSGALLFTPNVGDHVWVQFLDGDVNSPIYMWGMQDTNQQSQYPYATYQKSGSAPAKAAITRYGHWIEINPAGTLFATSNGYALSIVDSSVGGAHDGSVQLRTAFGHTVMLDDAGELFSVIVPNVYFSSKDFIGQISEVWWKIQKRFVIQGHSAVCTVDTQSINLMGKDSIKLSVGNNSIQMDSTGIKLVSGSTQVNITEAGIDIV